MNRGPIKRYIECDNHGRQPMTDCPDWHSIVACLECYIEAHQRTLDEALAERSAGGVDWYWHDKKRKPKDPSDEWAIGWSAFPPASQGSDD